MATNDVERPEGSLPPATESIHLPDPSFLAPVMAFGITLMVIGLTLGVFVIAVGAIIFLITLVRWIRQTREEMGQLPLDHS